jgi:hypothetical protein
VIELGSSWDLVGGVILMGCLRDQIMNGVSTGSTDWLDTNLYFNDLPSMVTCANQLKKMDMYGI